MKILEINKFNFAKGGADKHFLDIIRLLEKNGHKVAVFSMEHEKNLPSPWKKYFVSKVGYTGEYSFWQKVKGAARMFYSFETKRKINGLLDEFQPDIVHIHNIYHQLSPAILFEIKKRNIPIVMTVHDFKIICPNHSLYHNGKIYDRCKNGKYYQCFLDKCVKNSYAKSFLAMAEMYWHNCLLKTYKKNVDLYIAPSRFAKNVLEEWGIAPEKIKVLPHFIADNNNTVFQYTVLEKSNKDERENNQENKQVKVLPHFIADNNNTVFQYTVLEKSNKDEQENKREKYRRKKYGDYSGNYALYIGRISKNKGVDILINIFKNLKSVKLYLCGEIEDGIDLEKSENIKYLGFLNQAEIQDYLKKARFIVSGSKLPETFGLIALETIAQGKPFIGFKSGAYGEIIKGGVNGFLAKDEKEMEKIIKKIIRGKIVFNSREIKKTAFRKYNQDAYGKTFLTYLAFIATL